MASRPLLSPFPVIEDGDMSDDITSTITIITNMSMMSYAYVWTGSSPIGSIVVEVSNDYKTNAAGDELDGSTATWTALTLTDTTDVSGNSGTGYIDIDQLGAHAIRTRYERTSGTGTLQCFFKGKVA